MNNTSIVHTYMHVYMHVSVCVFVCFLGNIMCFDLHGNADMGVFFVLVGAMENK
jgi:hypothetical protein